MNSVLLLFFLAAASSAGFEIPFHEMQTIPTAKKGETLRVWQDPAWLARLGSGECRDLFSYVDKGTNSYALIVLRKDGTPLLERYYKGTGETNRFKMWSISKTASVVLLGALERESQLSGSKFLTRDTKVSRYLDVEPYIDGESDEGKRNIRLENLWNMSAGLDWCEYSTCSGKDTILMSYTDASEDAADYILSRPLLQRPGVRYTYSAGNATLMHAVIKAALKKKFPRQDRYSNIFGEKVFSRIGVSDYALERDGKGVGLGGSGLFLNPRAYASLGLLLLNRGDWFGDRVVSEEFFRKMITTNKILASPETPKEIRNWESSIGSGVWLNRKDHPEIPQYLPHMPEDMFYGAGAYGQNLLMFPTEGLVVARIGGDADYSSKWIDFTDRAYKCFSGKPLVDAKSFASDAAPASSWFDNAMTMKKFILNAVPAKIAALETCNCLFVTKMKNIAACNRLLPAKSKYQAILDESHVNYREKSVVAPISGPLSGIEYSEVKARLMPGAHATCKLVD
jgi:CubicO group peptidase (beta-lactamase class C family)